MTRTFENLIVWQKVRLLTKDIYLMTQKKPFCNDYGLSSQMQRAAVSILSNIAEGSERASDKDFNRFLIIANSSNAELKSQLYVAKDIGYINQQTFMSLYLKIDEIGKAITGLRKSLTLK